LNRTHSFLDFCDVIILSIYVACTAVPFSKATQKRNKLETRAIDVIILSIYVACTAVPFSKATQKRNKLETRATHPIPTLSQEIKIY